MGKVSQHGYHYDTITVILSDSDREILGRMVAQDGQSLSEFVRCLLRAEAKRRGLLVTPRRARGKSIKVSL